MDLGTIEITAEEAAARVAEYEKVLEEDRSVEDAAILQAYRAAKRGLPIISLSRAFDIGGFHDNGLPKLAIVRADAKKVWVDASDRSQQGARLVFADREWSRTRGALVGAHTVTVDTSVSRQVGTSASRRWRASTIVPLIPPRHRPKRGRIGNFHILWEVDEWTPAPPKDPALLRHIRGDLWSVLAVWDLTDLERLVLSQRRNG
jgi:hypothetical protein